MPTHAQADTWVCLKTGMCAVEKSGHMLRHRRTHTDTHVHSKEPGYGTRHRYVCTAATCAHTHVLADACGAGTVHVGTQSDAREQTVVDEIGHKSSHQFIHTCFLKYTQVCT